MTRFMITNDAVNTQGNNLEISVDDLRRVLERYRGTVEAAIGIWYGLGSGAFKTFDTQFQPVSHDLLNALTVMRGELEATNAAYTQDENEQQAAVTALNTAMPFGPNQQGGGSGPWDNIFGGEGSGGPEGSKNANLSNQSGDGAVHTAQDAANAAFDFGQDETERMQSSANTIFDWTFGSDGDGIVQNARDGGNAVIDAGQDGLETAQDVGNKVFDKIFG
jgi:hypothetical protein